MSEGKGKGSEFYFDLELRPRPSDMPPISLAPSLDSTDTERTPVVHNLAARHELLKLEERRSRIIQQCLSGDTAGLERTRRSSSARVTFEQLRILVVDDSAPTRKMAIRLLSGCNCSCIEAADGDEAVEKVRQSQDGEYDVILME